MSTVLIGFEDKLCKGEAEGEIEREKTGLVRL